jgi:hypothetical protein
MASWRVSSVLPLLCLIIVHRPDGAEVAVDTTSIDIIEPVETRHHYVYGAHTLLHVTGEKFSVREKPHEIEYLRATCKEPKLD